MKIVIMTVPLRAQPGDFVPFGALAVIQALREAGHDPYFLDIDALRPGEDEVGTFLLEYKPDVVGISAVVSTAYTYVKRVAEFLNEHLPDTRIVVGGNLCASSEVLLRCGHVDACVLSEGEIPMCELVAYYGDVKRGNEDHARLERIKSILFLHSDNEIFNTGYGRQLRPDEIRMPDYSILEQYSDISRFVHTDIRSSFHGDPRYGEAHRIGKAMTVVFATKGCINRCSFCHRWDRGLRVVDVDRFIEHVRHLQETYNVGYLIFGDECFGARKRFTAQLVERLKELDVLWVAGGVRVNTVDLDTLRSWKDAGCCGVNFGLESGSEDILTEMEKHITLEENYKGIDDIAGSGLFSTLQLVIGMPSENPRTIRETKRMVRYFVERTGITAVSINFAQALPGTPLYEYGRFAGILGRSIAEEERYLLRMFNRNAADPETIVNYTKYSYITLRCWMYYLYQEVERTRLDMGEAPALPPGNAIFYFLWVHSTRGIAERCMRLLRGLFPGLRVGADMQMREADIGRSRCLYPLRIYLNFLRVVRIVLHEKGVAYSVRSVFETVFRGLRFHCTRESPILPLRKQYEIVQGVPPTASEISMEPLRRGR